MRADAAFELVHPDLARSRFRAVLFDFDGTLSLLREGWTQIMIPMMVAALRETQTAESDQQLTAVVEEFVLRLNGRPTVDQMHQLVAEIRQRGGSARTASEYKNRFHTLLMEQVDVRVEAIVSGAASAADWAVPGAHALLEQLQQRGLKLYLASGTDIEYVRQEAELLEVGRYFGEQIYAPRSETDGFSKAGVIERFLKEERLHGSELLGFGDGVVETEAVKRAGGVFVAVASDWEHRHAVNPWKRERLLQASADLVIPDYHRGDELLAYLFGEA